MVKSRGLRFPWHSEGTEFWAALGAVERSGVLLKCGNECATGKWREVPVDFNGIKDVGIFSCRSGFEKHES